MSDHTAPLTAPLVESDAARPARGQTVGRFVLLSQLGAGGSGEVYAAFDPLLDRKVAIKLLKGNGRDETELVREGRFLAKLSHPGVVAVHDAGVHEGRAFLAMELVDGQDLAAWAKPYQTSSDWRVLLSALRHAGEGLAAAHDGGLVHGDIKPSNVLVGSDGRARVSDFGIARAGATEPLETSDPDAPRPRAAGTPRYMAPEQHEGIAADTRSDQYAFCLTAWTVLTGEHPYADAARELSNNASDSATQEGAGAATHTPDASTRLPEWIALAEAQRDWVPTWPGTPRVPNQIVDVLRRGLALDPAARFESMTALLHALTLPRSRARFAVVVAGGAALAGAATTLAFADDRALCSGAEDELAEVWNDTRADTIAEAFTTPGVAFAADTWTRIEPRLAGYASGWIEQHRQTCEATTVRGEQSDEVMDLRMACLRKARASLEAVTTTLASADLTTIENASEVVDELVPLEYCGDVERLTTVMPLPKDPELVAAIESARAEIAAADTTLRAGHYLEARDRFAELAPTVQAIDYPPLHVELDVRRGAALMLLDELAQARMMLERALQGALTNQQWELAMDASIELTDAVGHRMDLFAEGRALGTTALGLAKRDDADNGADAVTFNVLGLVEQKAGDYAAAEARYREALAAGVRAFGAQSSRVGGYRCNLGNLLRAQSRFDEAETEMRAGLEILEKSLGASHPRVAMNRAHLARILESRGEFDQAEQEHQRALELRIAALGEDAAEVATSRIAMASLEVSRGRPERGLPLIDTAIEALENKLGPEASEVGTALNTKAIILSELGRPADAVVPLRRALEIQTKLLGADHPEVGTLHDTLGAVLLYAKRYDEAEPELRRALEIRVATLGTDNEPVLTSYNNIAAVLLYQGKLEESEAEFRNVLALAEKLWGKEHPVVANTNVSLAAVLQRQKRNADALPHLEAAWAFHRDRDASQPSRANAANRLAQVLVATDGDRERAQKLARTAAEAYRTAGPQWNDQVTAIETWLDEL